MLSVSSSFSSLLLLLYDDDDDIQCVSSLSSVLLSISFLLQNANWIAFAISPSSAKDFGKDFLPIYRNLPTTVLIGTLELGAGVSTYGLYRRGMAPFLK